MIFDITIEIQIFLDIVSNIKHFILGTDKSKLTPS